MTISTSDLTSNRSTSTTNLVTGDGVFDELMEAVNAHLSAQYNLGRITGTDYSTVYLGALQSAIQQAVAFLIGREKGNAEISLLAQKEVTEYAQTQQSTKTAPNPESIMGEQAILYDQQAKGFKWNADQKYMKTLLDAWSVNASTGTLDTNITAIQAPALNVIIPDAKPTQ